MSACPEGFDPIHHEACGEVAFYYRTGLWGALGTYITYSNARLLDGFSEPKGGDVVRCYSCNKLPNNFYKG
jgi:hypothetical protein